jgi:hypothetical protein
MIAAMSFSVSDLSRYSRGGFRIRKGEKGKVTNLYLTDARPQGLRKLFHDVIKNFVQQHLI